MADLSIAYSKTPKGLRARSSLIGGLSGKLMKVLSFIDGVSKAQSILTKHDISVDKLLDALTKLENDGYIKPAVVSVFNDDEDWDFGDSTKQIVVEELVLSKAANLAQIPITDNAQLQAEPLKEKAENAKQAEQAQQQKIVQEKAKELEKVQQQEALIKAIEKAKAQTKVQERMHSEAVLAQKNLKLESLKKIKAAQAAEAAKIAHAKLALEEKAKLEQRLMEQKASAAQAKLAAQKLAEAKTEELRLAAENRRAEKARHLQDAEAKKAAKAALLEQKIAAAEAEQLRLMAEFEAQTKLEEATTQQPLNPISHLDDAAHHALVAEAKLKLKAKAEARAKAEAEKLALAKANQKIK